MYETLIWWTWEITSHGKFHLYRGFGKKFTNGVESDKEGSIKVRVEQMDVEVKTNQDQIKPVCALHLGHTS